MANVHPHGWEALLADLDNGRNTIALGVRRELDTLRQLASTLPDEITIYHGVQWAHLSESHTVIDDIDFVLIGPQGKVLLIEQVAGFLNETPAGLSRKRPPNRDAPPHPTLPSTLAHTVATLAGRLRRASAGDSEKVSSPDIDALLYCPDYTVRNAGTAGLPPERIVDASQRDTLPQIISALLLTESVSTPDSAGRREKMHRFFADLLQLAPEASAIVGEAQGLTTRLAGGLSSWARRLHFSPHRLRVIGTAGSGKTQLALAVIRDALTARRRPLYVCYNRPLADHIARTLSQEIVNGAEVATFHQLCDKIGRRAGEAPDFDQPGAFQQMAQRVAELPEAALADWQFDELIVDEGQDFESGWVNILFRLLRSEGRAWWLEDPMQNLYGRPPAVLPSPADWVELRCKNNYRTPRAILETIHSIVGADTSDQNAGNPIIGQRPEILSYTDDAGLIEQTKRAIGIGIAAGFKRQMIAVLTFRGRERSRFSPLDRLGPYSLRAFTGRYDLLGNPIHTEGEIVIDSLMRFKGQAAPFVVLTEIEFDQLDDAARRRLFVGATRSTLSLILVAQEKSARHLRECLGNEYTSPTSNH